MFEHSISIKIQHWLIEKSGNIEIKSKLNDRPRKDERGSPLRMNAKSGCKDG